MSYIAGCISVGNGDLFTKRSAAMLHAMRNKIEWLVSQNGNNNGVIGVSGKKIDIASDEEWVVAVQGGPVFKANAGLVKSEDIINELSSNNVNDMVSSLKGHFSCAVYNKFQTKLWLYTDGSGLYPLYWFKDEKSITFATQPLYLAKNCMKNTLIDPESIRGFLLGFPEYISGCLIDGINLIAPGEIVLWDGINCEEAVSIANDEPYFRIDELKNALPKFGKIGVFVPDSVNSIGNFNQVEFVENWRSVLGNSATFLSISPVPKIEMTMFLANSIEVCQFRHDKAVAYYYWDALVKAKKCDVDVVLDCSSFFRKKELPDDCIHAVRAFDSCKPLIREETNKNRRQVSQDLTQYANAYGISLLQLGPSLNTEGQIAKPLSVPCFTMESNYRYKIDELQEILKKDLRENERFKHFINCNELENCLDKIGDSIDDFFVERFEFVWRVVYVLYLYKTLNQRKMLGSPK